MAFKKHMTPLKVGGGGQRRGRPGHGITMHKGKGATEETLPSRQALSKLTEGDPMDRTMNDYGKATPPIGAPSAGAPSVSDLASALGPGTGAGMPGAAPMPGVPPDEE
jgi:hypothetical protein